MKHEQTWSPALQWRPRPSDVELERDYNQYVNKLIALGQPDVDTLYLALQSFGDYNTDIEVKEMTKFLLDHGFKISERTVFRLLKKLTTLRLIGRRKFPGCRSVQTLTDPIGLIDLINKFKYLPSIPWVRRVGYTILLLRHHNADQTDIRIEAADIELLLPGCDVRTARKALKQLRDATVIRRQGTRLDLQTSASSVTPIWQTKIALMSVNVPLQPFRVGQMTHNWQSNSTSSSILGLQQSEGSDPKFGIGYLSFEPKRCQQLSTAIVAAPAESRLTKRPIWKIFTSRWARRVHQSR